MNERIKEFAEKTLSKDQFGLWLAGDDDIEKFANLIVQECSNVLYDNELWSRDVSHVLNEHFGVE